MRMLLGALGVTPIAAAMRILIASTAKASNSTATVRGESPLASEIDSSARETSPSARNNNQKKVTAPRSTPAT